MSGKENLVRSDSQDRLFHELSQQNPDRETALAAYRIRDEGWDQLEEPVRFLRNHPLVDDDGTPGPNILQTWVGLALVLVLLGGFGYAVSTFDLKLSGYFARLFTEPGKEAPVPPDRPEEISVSGFTPEYRIRIDRINEHISAEQWKDVVEGAMSLKNEAAAIAVIRNKPQAFSQLFEVLTAAKMALRTDGLENANEVLGLIGEYRETGGKPTFKLEYQGLLARFELAGGDKIGYGAGEYGTNKTVIEISDRLSDTYGTEISELQTKQLRMIRVYSLIRLLDPKKDLKAINGSELAKGWWHRLTTDLAMWRGAFPTAEKVPYKPWDRSPWVKAWRAKSRDFLKCDAWYWRRLADLEPWKGKSFKIGDMEFDGNKAEFNAKVIGEALR